MGVFQYTWTIDGDSLVETTTDPLSGETINEISLLEFGDMTCTLDRELVRSARELRKACWLMKQWLENDGGWDEALEERIKPLMGEWWNGKPSEAPHA